MRIAHLYFSPWYTWIFILVLWDNFCFMKFVTSWLLGFRINYNSSIGFEYIIIWSLNVNCNIWPFQVWIKMKSLRFWFKIGFRLYFSSNFSDENVGIEKFMWLNCDKSKTQRMFLQFAKIVNFDEILTISFLLQALGSRMNKNWKLWCDQKSKLKFFITFWERICCNLVYSNCYI